MIAYVMLGANDLTRARAFYDALLAPLGLTLNAAYTSPTRIWYSAGMAPPMLVICTPHDGRPATWANGGMLALAAPSRTAVEAAHQMALELGGLDEGAPGLRGDDPSGFYGAYFRDPDGNKIAVFKVGPPDG